MVDTLDLRWRGRLGVSLTPRFDAIAWRMRDSFHASICKLSEEHQDDIDWWLSSALSRNIFVSPLYYRLCAIQLAHELLSKGILPKRILVDSLIVKKYISDMSTEADVFPEILLDRYKSIPFSIQSVAIFMRSFWLWLLVRVFVKKTRDVFNIPLILIDTFVSPGFYNKDRYYPGLLKNLEPADYDRTHMVPTLSDHSPLNYFSAISALRRNHKVKWLYREHYINLADLIYAVSWWLRARRLSVSDVSVSGVNLGSLVKEELNERRELGAAFTALVNMRFFKRLSDQSVELSTVVDWHENQPVDKGWNAGVNKYYPDATSLGYQGYVVTPHYLVMYPLECELKAGLLPKRISVIGEGYIQDRKRYCPEMNISTAPAFRFDHLYSQDVMLAVAGGPSITIALPKDENLANGIVALLVEESPRRKKWSWKLKAHPTHSEHLARSWADNLPVNARLCDETISELLRKSSILISAASSVCLEAIACGVPVVIIAGDRGLIHNPIPEDVDRRIWKTHNSDLSDLIESVSALLDFLDQEKAEVQGIAKNVRLRYFKQVSKEHVYSFMGLQ